MRRVIGFTKNNNIIKAKISCERVDDNKDPKFLVEFNLFKIARTEDTIKNYDFMYPYYEYTRDLYDPEEVLDLLDEYDCTPSELADRMTREAIEDEDIAMEVMDYVDKFETEEGEEYIHIELADGQFDIHKDIGEVIDEELFNDIYELWDKYYLKDVDDVEKAMDLYNSIYDRMKFIEDEDFIVDYIERKGL